MLSATRLDQLIADVYAAATGQVSWQVWLTAFCSAGAYTSAQLKATQHGADPRVVARVGATDATGTERWATATTPHLMLACNCPQQELDQVWGVLAPHLERATEVATYIDFERSAAYEPMRTLAESIGAGLLLLRARDSHVMYANACASRLLERTESLTVHGNQLQSAAELRPRLLSAVKAVQNEDSRNGEQLWFEDSSGRYTLLVRALHGWSARSKWEPASNYVLLMLTDAEALPGLRSSYLRNRHNLTPKESRLTLGLMRGRKLDVLATDFGVSVHTLRTQLKAILRKTHTGSQTGLVKLLSTDHVLLFAPQPDRTQP